MKYTKHLVITVFICNCILFTSFKEAGKENVVVAGTGTEVSFVTSDNIRIYGDYYPGDSQKATILLCHQGGSNARAEYSGIIDTLQQLAYPVLAIDMRTGGQLYGSWNRTIAHLGLSRYSYCDAYSDLEAAVDFLRKDKKEQNIILWGSSFSAALVIKYANKHPQNIYKVLAFSPASGEPMQGCMPEEFFETLKVPLLVLRPGKEMEIEYIKEQIAKASKYNHQTYVSDNGVHGSSMLVEDRTKHDVKSTWQKVMGFIQAAN